MTRPVRVAPAAFLLLSVAGCSSTAWRDADARLLTASEAARAQGFAPLSGPHNTFGDFSSPGETDWRVHLEAHQEYFIAAACTQGCDTLDFRVSEPHGNELARDTSAGAAPRLRLQAPEEGDYRITVTFGQCAVVRCHWVAQIYGRPVR